MKRAFTMEIEKMVYGGKGMGRAGGKVVFVPFTAPGERVEVEIVREKKNYAEASLRRIITPSPRRRKPFCALFGECGGCHYQHFFYGDQLEVKENVLREALHPVSRKAAFEILSMIPSPADRSYRIRAQMKVGEREGRRVLGFYAWGTNRVVPVQECPLLHPVANRIVSGLNAFLRERKEIALKGADIQVSPDEGRGVVNLRTEGSWRREWMEEAGRGIPEIQGIVLEGKEGLSWGVPSLGYEVSGKEGKKISLRSAGKSFVQVNPDQNRNLIQRLLEWASPRKDQTAVDLFCGSGNLTLPLALEGGSVWGVDQDREAIDFARENARRNRITNCRFYAGNAEQGIARIQEEIGKVDLVVLDPPRLGAPRTVNALVSLQPGKILYVSCEPPTLARDLARLLSLGYNVKRLQPLDMFPQTYHMEAIAELVAVGGSASAFRQNKMGDC